MFYQNNSMTPMAPVLKIGIIEDDPHYADNLSLILMQNPGLEIALISPSIEAATSSHAAALAQCHCVLLDINLQGQNGICGMPQLRGLLPAASQIIMLTLHEGTDTIREAFRQGASGYLLKSEKLQLLREYICSSLRLQAPAISRPVFEVLVQDSLRPQGPDLSYLTDREQEIYGFLLKGWDNKRMAAMLHISGATVNFHLKNIFIKRNVHTRAELLSKHLEAIQQVQ